ncbi:hypothetical protein [Paenibacillus caui]|uniref:hypothetical protein n=1 Tax=Paenibacillus caui TaxID=2873927 RepID=UPI001CA96552|nr:hypothetical protein [Paenibacillus caui]
MSFKYVSKYGLIPLFFFACIAYVIFFITNSENHHAKAMGSKKIHSAHADYPVLSTVTELTYKADLIVTGMFTGNRVPKFYTDENGEIIVRASTSEFEIQKVHKGVVYDKIISVIEPAYEDNNEIYTIEGYKLMNKFDKFILFLGNTDEGAYRIVGMYQGQYNTNSTIKINSMDGNNDETEYFGSQSEIKHYKRLKEQVLELFKNN